MIENKVRAAQQLLATNRQITAAIVKEAVPALIQLSPKEQRHQSPSVKTSMLRRATGGSIFYPVPIEGGYDMKSYEDIRVKSIMARTDIRPGATPLTVTREHSVTVGYAKLGDLSCLRRPLYSTEVGIADNGDVSSHGRSVYPSREVKSDLFHLQRAGVLVQCLAETAVAIIQETTGVQVSAAADLSAHAVEWRRQFPDLDKGPYMQSLIFMPTRAYTSR